MNQNLNLSGVDLNGTNIIYALVNQVKRQPPRYLWLVVRSTVDETRHRLPGEFREPKGAFCV